ncbi:hypothetical protein FRAHR75_520051 [Frankia sp. Hr75.2]|nr:hypothetical protein FRAHR75_520051 [Frankia sp. Hr75.2]
MSSVPAGRGTPASDARSDRACRHPRRVPRPRPQAGRPRTGGARRPSPHRSSGGPADRRPRRSRNGPRCTCSSRLLGQSLREYLWFGCPCFGCLSFGCVRIS